MSKVNGELDKYFGISEIEDEKSLRGVYCNLYKMVKVFQNTRRFHGKTYKISFDSKMVEGFGEYLICTVSKVLLKDSQSPKNYVICGVFEAPENYETYQCIGALFDKHIASLQKEGFIFYQVSDMKSWRCCSVGNCACPMCQHNRSDFFKDIEERAKIIQNNGKSQANNTLQKQQDNNNSGEPQQSESIEEKYKKKFKVVRGIADVFPSIPIERKLPCILHSTQRMTEKFLTKIICMQDWVKNKEEAQKFFKKFGISISFVVPNQKQKKQEEVTTVSLETDKFEVGMMKYTRLF